MIQSAKNTAGPLHPPGVFIRRLTPPPHHPHFQQPTAVTRRQNQPSFPMKTPTPLRGYSLFPSFFFVALSYNLISSLLLFPPGSRVLFFSRPRSSIIIVSNNPPPRLSITSPFTNIPIPIATILAFLHEFFRSFRSPRSKLLNDSPFYLHVFLVNGISLVHGTSPFRSLRSTCRSFREIRVPRTLASR